MKHVPFPTALLLALAVALTANAQPQTPNPVEDAGTLRGKTTIEFRFAEDKPAEGLVEATVGESDEKIYLHKSAVLTLDDIAHAHTVSNEHDVQIECHFTESGAKKMAQLSSENIGKRLAIIVNGKVISAPIIRGKISSKATITGSISKEEAQRIASAIAARPQPASSSQELEDLRKRYEASEAAVREATAKVRELLSGKNTDLKLVELSKNQLRLQIGVSFGLRQELHQAELAAMEQKLRRSRERIERRNKSKDQIIERRVEELLNPHTTDSRKSRAETEESDAERLQGAWRLVGVELGGKERPLNEQDREVRFVFDDNILTQPSYPPFIIVQPAPFELNAKASPKQLIVKHVSTEGEKKPHAYLYRFRDGLLELCYDPENVGRFPKDFATTPESSVSILTFRREATMDELRRQAEHDDAAATLKLIELVTRDGEPTVAATYYLETENRRLLKKPSVTAGVTIVELPSLPEHADVPLKLRLLLPHFSRRASEFVARNSIRLWVDEKDLAEVIEGKRLVRAFYYPKNAPKSDGSQLLKAKTLDTGKRQAEWLTETEKLGDLIAVIEITRGRPAEPAKPKVSAVDRLQGIWLLESEEQFGGTTAAGDASDDSLRLVVEGRTLRGCFDAPWKPLDWGIEFDRETDPQAMYLTTEVNNRQKKRSVRFRFQDDALELCFNRRHPERLPVEFRTAEGVDAIIWRLRLAEVHSSSTEVNSSSTRDAPANDNSASANAALELQVVVNRNGEPELARFNWLQNTDRTVLHERKVASGGVTISELSDLPKHLDKTFTLRLLLPERSSRTGYLRDHTNIIMQISNIELDAIARGQRFVRAFYFQKDLTKRGWGQIKSVALQPDTDQAKWLAEVKKIGEPLAVIEVTRKAEPADQALHLRGAKAKKYVEKYSPAWGEEKSGLQLGVSRLVQRSDFGPGERLPLALCLRNTGEKILGVQRRIHVFVPKPLVRDSQGEKVSVAGGGNVRRGLVATDFSETLKPNDVIVFAHPGLHTISPPDEQDLVGFPLLTSWEEWKTVPGKYMLSQFDRFRITAIDGKSAEEDLVLHTGTLPFEITSRRQSRLDEQPSRLRESMEYLAARQDDEGWFGTGVSPLEPNTGVTAICALALLRADATWQQDRYEKKVDNAIDYILKHREDNGLLSRSEHATHGLMYEHAFATWLLAEAIRAGRPMKLQDPLRKAVKLIVASQNEDGGWRYDPKPEDADVPVTAVTVVALAEARRAGVDVPQATFERAAAYLKKCQNPIGGFRYQLAEGPEAPSRSAAALAALYECGKHGDADWRKGWVYVVSHLRTHESQNESGANHLYFGHLFAVRASAAAEGDGEASAVAWYTMVYSYLGTLRRADGSWPDLTITPKYATAMACLTLLSTPTLPEKEKKVAAEEEE